MDKQYERILKEENTFDDRENTSSNPSGLMIRLLFKGRYTKEVEKAVNRTKSLCFATELLFNIDE